MTFTVLDVLQRSLGAMRAGPSFLRGIVMTVLLCPYCFEPSTEACDDPTGYPVGWGDFACSVCGVLQTPGKPHAACEVCHGQGMLTDDRKASTPRASSTRTGPAAVRGGRRNA